MTLTQLSQLDPAIRKRIDAAWATTIAAVLPCMALLVVAIAIGGW